MSKPSAVVSKMSRRKKLRLGELLLEAGAITQDQLEQALTLQKQSGHKLGRALTEVGAIEESELYKFLAKRLETARARAQAGKRGFAGWHGRSHRYFCA